MSLVERFLSLFRRDRRNVWELLEKRAGYELRGSERGALIEGVQQFGSLQSVFEIGCGTGVNLPLLRLFFPSLQYLGLDRNLAALQRAEKPQSSLWLLADAARGHLPVRSQSVDLSFSVAALLYVSGDHIHEVLREMLRISRRGLLLVEQEDPELSSKGTFITDESTNSGYWLRSYRSVLEEIGVSCQVTKLASPRFQTEQWQTYGSLIISRP